MTRTHTLIASIALIGTALSAAPALADNSGFDVEYRRQQERIDQGVRNGSLTRHEAIGLRDEQNRIATMIDRARRDGRVDPYERGEIDRAQAAASAHIYREKHDAEARPVRYGWWHRNYEAGPRRWW
jgi:low affinity Fe/Cu permease